MWDGRREAWDRRRETFFLRETGDVRQEMLDRRHKTGVWDRSMRQETWDRRCETGDMRHETGDMGQDTQDTRHETEDKRRETTQTRYVRQDMWDVRQETWDRRYDTWLGWTGPALSILPPGSAQQDFWWVLFSLAKRSNNLCYLCVWYWTLLISEKS